MFMGIFQEYLLQHIDKQLQMEMGYHSSVDNVNPVSPQDEENDHSEDSTSEAAMEQDDENSTNTLPHADTSTDTTSSVLRDITFHVQTSFLSEDNSTEDSIQQETASTDSLDGSFNISNRDISDPEEIQENPIADESLSTTVLDEGPVQYEFFEEGSKRGKPLVVSSDGYKYYVKKKLVNSVLWTCCLRSKKIKCYATLVQKGAEFTRGPNPHQHGPEPSLREKVKVNIQVKSEAKRHIFKSSIEIVNTALQEHIQPKQPGLPLPASVARAANRHRSKFRPAEPRDLDFTVNYDYLQCEDFLVADINNGNARHMVFATQEQLKLLSNTKRWFMDGTFKIIGEPFSSGQLESIHGFVGKDGIEKQVPMAFILMSRRRTEDYVKVLTAIKESLDNTVVESFVLDFEQAAWIAVKDVFPGVMIKGCVFHYTQALWRKVQDLGLKQSYLERASVHQYIRQMMALPFLPSTHIEPAFIALARRANTQQLNDFVEYMDRQWMNHAVFQIESLSVFGITVRTNNDTEGWHHRLNRRAGHQSLSFYRLVPALRNEAELVDYELRLIRDGISTRRIRPVYRQIEEKIKILWTKYSENEITTSELLRSCSKIYGPQCEYAEV